ncbi:MAG: hypothetical protein LH469_05190 [Frankiaceae bacterium]|nr:hypothetical protein [Frankiaceae bacterium]
MSSPTARCLLAATAALALTACGGSETTSQAAEEPASPAASSVAPADTPVHGSWRLDLTADQLRETLIRTGFGAQAEQFLRVEEVEAGVKQVLTVQGSTFAFAYQAPDETWYVGWQGEAQVEDDLLRLSEDGTFNPDEGTDVLRWDVEGDELDLEVVSANDVVIKGIANEAFLQAYLATQPFVRTTCAPTEATCT